MNIYEDYGLYMKEASSLINKISEINSSVVFCLTDVIKVTDYIYQLYLDKNKISDDLSEVFDIGYGYLSNTIEDLKTYYHSYFKDKIEAFNYYSEVIVYLIYIDDYRSYLDSEGLLTDDIKNKIDDVMTKLDDLMALRYPFKTEELKKMEDEITDIAPYFDEFKPVYSVFSMMVEELDLY